jgi:hypothetical protein
LLASSRWAEQGRVGGLDQESISVTDLLPSLTDVTTTRDIETPDGVLPHLVVKHHRVRL